MPIATSSGPAYDLGPGERIQPGELQPVAGARTVTSTSPQRWMLPTPTPGAAVTVVLDASGATPATRSLVITLLDPGGHLVRSTVAVVGTRATLQAPRGFAVEAVQVASAIGSPPMQVGMVVESSPTTGLRYMLDGMLQGAVTPPHWRYGGTIGGLPVFLNTRARGPSYVAPASSVDTSSLPVPGATAVTAPVPVGGAMRTDVRTPVQGLVVRSTAFAPDWYAQVTPAGGEPYLEPVRALGPVQAASVPAGRSVVEWLYRPTSIAVGWWLTVAATLAFLAGLVVLVVVSARRRAPTP